MRIVSLLPSATEIVYSLGLGGQLLAVTHECDYPVEATRLPVATASAINHAGHTSAEIDTHVNEALHKGSSIYHLDQDLLRRLNPDLILTQELCDVCAVSYNEVKQAARLLGGERRVVSLEPTSIASILETVQTVGEIAGVKALADSVVAGLKERLAKVQQHVLQIGSKPRVFALEWLDPAFVGGHWVPEMVRLAGAVDGLGTEGAYSSVIPWEQVFAYDPEIIVLMPCGFHLSETIAEFTKTKMPDGWQNLTAVQSGQVFAVDGSAYFNRPGPRVVDGLEILAEIIHPGTFPRKHPESAWTRL